MEFSAKVQNVIENKIRVAVLEEREACAKEAEAQAAFFLSSEYATGQPMSSFMERFACKQVAAAIRCRTIKNL